MIVSNDDPRFTHVLHLPCVDIMSAYWIQCLTYTALTSGAVICLYICHQRIVSGYPNLMSTLFKYIQEACPVQILKLLEEGPHDGPPAI